MLNLATRLHTKVDLETLDAELASSPSLGVRRLLRLAEQLAAELDQAQRLGSVPVDFTLRGVLLEHPGTPFERIRIPYWSGSRSATRCVREALKQVGSWLCEVLAEKRLYLDSALSLYALQSAPRALTSRADLEILRAVARGLRAIAKRCQGGSGAVAYSSAAALAHDLARLGAVTSRVAGRLRQARASLLAHYPKPAACALERPLPKVILNLESRRPAWSAHFSTRDEHARQVHPAS